MTTPRMLKHFYQRFKQERASFIHALQETSNGMISTAYAAHLLQRFIFDRFLPCGMRCEAVRASALLLPHGSIVIPEAALARLFAFFDDYQWQRDEHEPPVENTVQPDVLGYIFEQQINQKQMGAYYTREDVTSYITINTILPYLLDAVATVHPHAFEKEQQLWQLLYTQPDRYIHQSLQCETYLPTETEREYRLRRERCQQLYTSLQTGKLCSVTDLITQNLDLQQFVLDMIATCCQPDLLLTFYITLEQMKILDPTCGTGAFLITALYVLESLYNACLNRMQTLLNEPDCVEQTRFNGSIRALLERTASNQRCFVRESIITSNLYGVEIMAEAVEICQMRFVLMLLTGNERPEDVERLLAQQWNICTGNALAQATWEKEFSDVIAHGGFDIIIGNPPYIEYSQVRRHYVAQGTVMERCGNLYAAMIKQSLALCRAEKGYIGLIVPLSMCSSERFAQLRRALTNNTTALWLANFEIFPCRLFDEAFQRLTILLTKHGRKQGLATVASPMYVTRIQRWYTSERPHLIKLIAYTPTSHLLKSDVFPKLASPLHEAILRKVVGSSEGCCIATLLSPHKTEHCVYYQEATNNWVKATCRIPFHKKNGVVTKPPHGRFLYFSNERLAHIVMALMNSSLFYLWFVTYSDGFHLSHSLVKAFPISKVLAISEALSLLAVQLESDIQRYAEKSSRNTKLGDTIEIEEYRMVYSKSLLDEIDGVVAKYCCFTDEELDFIVHYDSKYRVGKGNENSL